jgi:hypothetical protein
VDAKKISKAMKTQVFPSSGIFRFFGGGQRFRTWKQLRKILGKHYDVTQIGEGHFSFAQVGSPSGAKGDFPKEFVMKVTHPGRGGEDTYPEFAKLAQKMHSKNSFYPNVIAFSTMPRGETDIDDYNDEEVDETDQVNIALIEYIETSGSNDLVGDVTFVFCKEFYNLRNFSDDAYEDWFTSMHKRADSYREIGSISKEAYNILKNINKDELYEFLLQVDQLSGRLDMHSGNVGMDKSLKRIIVFDPVSFEKES